MAALAKQAMRKSFIHLLNEKPYHQITVKEIVEDCGLNRNTFYYHFHDLNELLETTMNDIVQQIVRAHPTLASVEACADALMEVILENRQAVLHLSQPALLLLQLKRSPSAITGGLSPESFFRYDVALARKRTQSR